MALQQLRSSTANKRPTAAAMSDGQLAVNTNATNPGLFFKDADGSVRKVGPVFIGSSAPNSSPASGGSTGHAVGEQWLDNTGGVYVLKIWDGTAWRSESGTFVDASGDNMTGNLTLGSTNIVLNASNGNITSVGSATFNSSIQSGEYASGAAGAIQIFNNTASTQAFKIGNTTNGSNIAMKSDGSASFASTVTSGSTTGRGQFLGTCPSSVVAASADAFVASYDGSSVAQIKYDGSATFDGTVAVGNTITGSSSVDGATIYDNGTVYLSRSGANNLIVGRQTGTSGIKVTINSDGSATFAGDVQVGDAPDVSAQYGVEIETLGRIDVRRSDPGDITFASYSNTGTSPAAFIRGNGSAEFAGFIRSTNGNGAAFLGASTTAGLALTNSGGSTSASILYDGGASFGNTSGGSSGTGGLQFSVSNGQLDLVNTNSGSFITAYNRNSTSQVFSVSADGSGTFAGNVFGNRIFARSDTDVDTLVVGTKTGTSAEQGAAIIKNDGSATFKAPSGSGVEVQTVGGNEGSKFPFVGKNTSGTTTFSVNGDGDATFRSTVSSGSSDRRGQFNAQCPSSVVATSAGCFVAGYNGSTVINMKYDGSATFAGGITSQNTILSNRTGSTQTAFQATLSGATKVNITAGGAATFDDQVQSNKNDGWAFEANATFQSGMGAYRSRSNGPGASNTYHLYATSSDNKEVVIRTDGSATFAGQVGIGISSPDGVTKLHVNNGTSDTAGGANSIGVGGSGVGLFATRITNTGGNFAFDRIYAGIWSQALSINRQTGAVAIAGSLSKGSGSFKVSHPLSSKTETHYLVHSFIEGPQADLIYRGYVDLVDGQATVNIDTAARMTEGTFEALCANVSCFTSNESDWTAVKGSVTGNVLTIIAQDSTATSKVSWMVVGERKDQHMLETDWTDANGRVITEPLKLVDETDSAES
nr:putative endosialidase [uncultured Mediterranean phage uvMED]